MTIADLGYEVRDSWKPDDNNDEILPYLGLGSVPEDDLHIEEVDSSLGVKSNKYKFKEGDILFGTLRPYFRKLVIASFDGICSTEFSVIRPHNDYDREYLFYALAQNKFIDYATTNSTGARPRTKWKLYSDFELNNTDKDQRVRIGEILSKYDRLIDINRRQIRSLEKSVRIVFNSLISPLNQNKKLQDGWRRRSTTQLIDVNPKVKVKKGKSIKHVPMGSLSENGMTVDPTDFECREKHTSVKFLRGDVLFAGITPCLENGKTAYTYFLEEGEVACGSTEFIVLRGNKVSSYFTYCISRTYAFRQNAIKSMAGSSGRQRVQTSCFNDFILTIPPEHLMQQFDEFAQKYFTKIEALEKQNVKLKKARDLLLPRLMNGDIPV